MITVVFLLEHTNVVTRNIVMRGPAGSCAKSTTLVLNDRVVTMVPQRHESLDPVPLKM